MGCTKHIESECRCHGDLPIYSFLKLPFASEFIFNNFICLEYMHYFVFTPQPLRAVGVLFSPMVFTHGVHADFEFLPYISFIVAFIASECIKRYWESICGESKQPFSFTPPTPPYGPNWGHK